MKTSNKIITAATICLVLAIVAYTFIMRGAYQEALKNPVSSEVRIELKPVKYLNLAYDGDITFKKGNKFEIIVDREFKDSIKTVFINDGLDLDVSKLGGVTIFLPEFPKMNFVETTKDDIAYANGERGYRVIAVDKSFQSGNFMATFVSNTDVIFTKCQFDKIDVKGKENVSINLNNSLIKQLTVDLAKSSTLSVNYSKIQSKNIVLGDSCSLIVSGKEARAMFLK